MFSDTRKGKTQKQNLTFVDLKTIINWCYARAMFWVKIKTVFNLNFIPQAIKPDVYCWFFKIFYVNTNCSMLQLFVLSYWNSPWWGGEMIISRSAYFTSAWYSKHPTAAECCKRRRGKCCWPVDPRPLQDGNITTCFIMTSLFYVNVLKKCQKCQSGFAYKWGMQTHKIYHN